MELFARLDGYLKLGKAEGAAFQPSAVIAIDPQSDGTRLNRQSQKYRVLNRRQRPIRCQNVRSYQ